MRRESLKTLLLDRAILTSQQIGDAVIWSRACGGTWIEALVLAGVLDEDQLAEWVSRVRLLPRCRPEVLANVPAHIIARIPPEVASEHRLVPISIEEGGYLQVAMVDPTDDTAIEEIEFFAGRQLLRQVAAATAIAWALFRYYGVSSRLWPRTIVHAAAEAR